MGFWDYSCNIKKESGLYLLFAALGGGLFERRKNMKNFLKTFGNKLVAVLVSATLVAGFTPVAGVFAEEVSSDAIAVEAPAIEAPVVEAPIETPAAEVPAEAPVAEAPVTEVPVVEAPAIEAPVVEAPIEMPAADVVSADGISENYVSENAVGTADPEPILEKFREPITEWPDIYVSDEESAKIMASQPQYWSQPLWAPNTSKGYDAIVAYITNDAGEYAMRTFFVTDGTEWLLYDYGETMAMEFFTETELKDGKYIPVQKGKSRKDNAKTVGIDEAKIPVLTDKAFAEMVYDWRTLANVPFTRDAAGNLVYAGPKQENPDPDNPNPTPQPDSSLLQYKLTINSSSYEVRVTKEVPYTGRRHVGKWAKETAKQVPDLDIQVYRNGEFLDHTYYTIKYFNNLNVNGYGKELITPYFTVTLKNEFPFKSDRKVMASKKFGFSIIPVDISTVNFAVKRAKVTTTENGVRVSLNTPTATIGGVKIKLAAQGVKNPRTGFYTTSYKDNKVTVYGINNFTGSTTLNLSAARSMDYIF